MFELDQQISALEKDSYTQVANQIKNTIIELLQAAIAKL
jgi:hypothetical protein